MAEIALSRTSDYMKIIGAKKNIIGLCKKSRTKKKKTTQIINYELILIRTSGTYSVLYVFTLKFLSTE